MPATTREPRVSVSRSIFPIVNDLDRTYFGQRGRLTGPGRVHRRRQGTIRQNLRGEPEQLIEQLGEDEAIAAADTLLLTIPNQLGVDYCAHVLEALLTEVAPALDWR